MGGEGGELNCGMRNSDCGIGTQKYELSYFGHWEIGVWNLFGVSDLPANRQGIWVSGIFVFFFGYVFGISFPESFKNLFSNLFCSP
jgi:hypothetical protein